MTHEPASGPLWPLGVNVPTIEGGLNVISVRPGLNILVGPNGSGKTRALRGIKTALVATSRIAAVDRKIRYLAAGRSSPLESYRGSMDGPHHWNTEEAAVGHVSHRGQWWEIESLVGDLLALDSRADLKLKVQARLQQLFDRSIELSWSQGGLIPRFNSVRGGASYSASQEASGILQLVGLLSAIHNDEIGALIIDEPEISLHPQHQAFLLEEMDRVAGDPSESGKKLIVFATHSASFLPLHSIDDLPRFSFFNSIVEPPAQVADNDEILRSRNLAAMLARLSATHRTAIFAQHVLLVEGPSDEIVTTQLSRRFGSRLLARNAQIVPVTGKGEFPEVAKLFSLMGKRVAVLADLDALSDDNKLVNFFSARPGAAAAATRRGAASLAELDRTLRTALAAFMDGNADAVTEAATAYADWSPEAPADLRRRRLTLARLLTAPESFNGKAGSEAAALSERYKVLLEALGEVGCFLLRAGAIENHYETMPGAESNKPNAAALEAASFAGAGARTLEERYSDVVEALRYIAPDQVVDDDLLLRPKLGAAISAAFQSMTANTSDAELNQTVRGTIGSDAEVFSLSNISAGRRLRLRVSIQSTLFQRDNFPFDITSEDNVNVVIPEKLPGIRV